MVEGYHGGVVLDEEVQVGLEGGGGGVGGGGLGELLDYVVDGGEPHAEEEGVGDWAGFAQHEHVCLALQVRDRLEHGLGCGAPLRQPIPLCQPLKHL